MLLNATQIRVGMILTLNGEIYRVTDALHHTPGNLRGMIQAKMKNVRTGSNLEKRFRSDERVEKADMEQVEMEYLYADGDGYHFMNTETYDQISLNKEIIGDYSSFLTPNIHINVDIYNGSPVAVEMPKTVDLLVTEAEPGLKKAAVTSSNKKVTLETGLSLQVPHFVNEGDKVRIDTETGKYLERVK